MKIKIEMTSPLLGTVSGNEEIAKEFIVGKVLSDKTIPEDAAIKRAAEEEKTLPTMEGEINAGTTYFHRDENTKPFIYGYMIKGYCKAACDAMIDTGQFKKEDLKKVKLTRYSYKSTINKLISISPRRIYLETELSEFNFIERSLRAETMKGDRVCLARSEMAPEGTVLQCEIHCLNNKLWPYIEWWLDYGKDYGGIGQWRSSHYGSFTWSQRSGV